MGTIRRDHDTCVQEGERDYPRVRPYDTLDAATTIIYIYIYIYIWTTLGVFSLSIRDLRDAYSNISLHYIVYDACSDILHEGVFLSYHSVLICPIYAV